MDPASNSMRGVSPERYALAAGPEGEYFTLGEGDSIEIVDSVRDAFTFSTHEKAIATARSMAVVLRRPVDVIKLL